MEDQKPKSKAQEKRDEQKRCADKLRSWLKPGSTVYTVLRHVARSGMMRHISVQILGKNNAGETEIIDITYYAAKVLDWPLANDHGVKVSGCGMDMGFHLVYSLGYRLFKDLKKYRCSGKTCTHPDHINKGVDRSGRVWHDNTDAGHTLHHRWI